MSTMLLQHNVSDGMTKLDQEMPNEKIEITTQMVEELCNNALNQSDDEKTIADPDEWLEETPVLESKIEVENTKSQASQGELKKARIKEIKERRIKLKIFTGELEILASQIIEFRRQLQLMCLYLKNVEPHFIKAQELTNEMTKEVNSLELAVFEQKPMIPIQKLEHTVKLQDTP
jgi:hypothetical protein